MKKRRKTIFRNMITYKIITNKTSFEKTKINELKSKKIDIALLKAFVYYNLAFSIIENPFFIELIKTLYTEYNILIIRKLSTELLKREIIKVNLKVKKIIDILKNLTLVIDGWTSQTG